MKNLLNIFVLTLLTSTLSVAKPPTRERQEAHLNKTLTLWCTRLHVPKSFSDKIVLHVVPTQDLHLPCALGESRIGPDGQIQVSILDASEYPWFATGRKIKRDQENSVLHELTHILYSLIDEEWFVTRYTNWITLHK